DNESHGRNSSINSNISLENSSTPNATSYSSPLAANNEEEDDSPITIENTEEYSIDSVNNNYDTSNENSPTINSKMCAIFEYQPQNADEVGLSLNDEVEIIENEIDGWVKVRTDHGEGYVPSTYIAPVRKAIYDFIPDKDDEIPLYEGESVVVLGQEDEGWLKTSKFE
ncbi:hypothetical protein PIROE2DRAFT_18459, partial [Piromyces sp. E2]